MDINNNKAEEKKIEKKKKEEISQGYYVTLLRHLWAKTRNRKFLRLHSDANEW